MISIREKLLMAKNTMVRTVVSLDAHDKKWLDRKAREEGVTMTTLVRRAVRALRLKGASDDNGEPAFNEILRMTKGTWRKGDAAAWIRKLRRE
jgi:Ribbon-helix-helix protein, copG family